MSTSEAERFFHLRTDTFDAEINHMRLNEILAVTPGTEPWFCGAGHSHSGTEAIASGAANKCPICQQREIETITKGSFEAIQAIGKDNAAVRQDYRLALDKITHQQREIDALTLGSHNAIEKLGQKIERLEGLLREGFNLDDEDIRLSHSDWATKAAEVFPYLIAEPRKDRRCRSCGERLPECASPNQSLCGLCG